MVAKKKQKKKLQKYFHVGNNFLLVTFEKHLAVKDKIDTFYY